MHAWRPNKQSRAGGHARTRRFSADRGDLSLSTVTSTGSGDRGDGEGTSCLHGSNSANSFLPPTRQRKVEEEDSRRVLQANADLIQSLSAPTALHA